MTSKKTKTVSPSLDEFAASNGVEASRLSTRLAAIESKLKSLKFKTRFAWSFHDPDTFGNTTLAFEKYEGDWCLTLEFEDIDEERRVHKRVSDLGIDAKIVAAKLSLDLVASYLAELRVRNSQFAEAHETLDKTESLLTELEGA